MSERDDGHRDGAAVIAKLVAAAGKRGELVAALDTALGAAADEEGTRYYILHEDDGDADTLWFYELYRDRDALSAHASSAAAAALGPVLAPLLAARPELTYLTPLGGKGL